jgi:OOP family OmpA-OmpF porin
MIFFKAGLNDPLPGQEKTIEETVADINQFVSLSKIFNQRPSIVITGHADKSGTEEMNIQLSLERAEAFRLILLSHGVSANLTITGVGSQSQLNEARDGQDRAFNRRVTLKVNLPAKSQ